MSKSERLPHIETQRQYFNKLADIFLAPIPEDIQERTRNIVQAVSLSPEARVVDVGCGVGVIIGHLIEAGLKPSNIVGCDLSEQMIARARAKFPGVFFWQGDIADFPEVGKDALPNHLLSFESVFFNGCFGNMWNQDEAVSAAVCLLGEEGRIVISHPLGSAFVEALHESEPHIVPHRLPNMKTLESWCLRHNLRIDHFEDRPKYYLALLSKEPNKER